MIEYAIINDKYWQKGKLIGIHNRDDYIFQMNDRNDLLSEDKLRLNNNGTDIKLYEIMNNLYVEVSVACEKGGFSSIIIPKGHHEYPIRQLTRTNQLISKSFKYYYKFKLVFSAHLTRIYLLIYHQTSSILIAIMISRTKFCL